MTAPATLAPVGQLRSIDRTELLPRSYVVAPRLLGALLVRSTPAGAIVARITEVEAYRQTDPASHSYPGPSPRTQVMFGPPGHAYVYFVYGMHHCVNVACEPAGTGAAVLVRGAVVVDGQDLVPSGGGPATRWAQGPARLTRALDIGPAHDGVDLLAADAPLRLLRDDLVVARSMVRRGPRTGVRLAPDRAWRWWLEGAPGVSPYRRHPHAAT